MEAKRDFLNWQKRGLSFTASGYGKKIPTSYKVKHNNRWKRVYTCVYSNSGLIYIMDKGKEIYLNDSDLEVV
jgi:hypothetical protein